MKHLIASVALAAASAASAGTTETWNFDLSTGGEDVFWMSPTAVDPAAFRYDASFEITTVEATVSFLGSPITVDVTNDIDPMLRMGMASAAGPAPIVIVDQFIASPPPPETPSVSGNIRIELDAAGFGMASATNVMLGTVTQNIPPFGEVTVPLTNIRFAGTIEVTAVLTPPQDLDGDGVVGASDLAQLIGSWGACDPELPCPADFDGDGEVGASDLAALIGQWG
jgi:hypothetical protein